MISRSYCNRLTGCSILAETKNSQRESNFLWLFTPLFFHFMFARSPILQRGRCTSRAQYKCIQNRLLENLILGSLTRLLVLFER